MAEHRHKEFISQQLRQDSDLESCIYTLFNPNNPMMGEGFFESAILSLSNYLKADYVFVARLNKKEGMLDTVTHCHNNKILPQQSFPYKDTPCDPVVADKAVTYQEKVRKEFPNSNMLAEYKVEAYSGIPLYGSSRKPIGVLVALFCDRIPDVEKVEALMFMYSSRIGSELEHVDRQQELTRRNMELLVFKEELIRKNMELDQMNNELKEATLKAEESNKLKSSFLANLSHEVRTPMNAIIGFTELLKSNHLSIEEKDEYLNIIHQNGNQMMRVMDALIDISKLQAKVYVEPKQKVRVNHIITELYQSYCQELEAMKKPIKLNILLGAENGADILIAHKEALYKIFDHMLDNAIKFTPQGNIYIGYTLGDDFFEFFVKDTGVGIEEGQEKSIFDLFRQGDLKKSREFGGNGIGLSIVKKYVEIMGGKVWAERDQKEGTLFKFTIPCR
ncbi:MULTISPECIES: sensor histidine kinase [unclassified Saccharicrinis]|uniref:sensor histidine kinase n=1 Tax=unclassified Saccharicrinis TaxID=2646859 RepID=UPI003D32ADFF